jgi:ABC-type glycerol-3-phosphate transport system permease component
MNGDIYGFQSLSYLKFINFIDFSKVAIFKDYSRDWYAVMAPYYMNFLIIAIISPLINLFVSCISGWLLSWKVKSAC